MMLADIKTLLGVKDDEQDDLLLIIIGNVARHLTALLGKEVPTELQFIIEEVTIKRFNRLGSEGMQSESVEGHSITFQNADDFEPYYAIIEANKEAAGIPRRGTVRFL